jgi:3-keto-L-gulonate-6-phosphate decarboxylase
MSRRQLTFRQNDVARAIKGAVAGGLTVQRVEVDKTGKIIVVVGEAGKTDAPTENSWDSV